MSNIFESFLSTPEVMEALSDRNFIAAMLRFEAALARAQASISLIPQGAAQSIVGTCKVELFDVPKLVRESGRSHCMASAVVNSLRETVGLFNQDAAAFVHYGCSSQDLVDSAMSLVIRDVLSLIEADLDQAVTLLLTLGASHAADPMLARTQLQPASVTSFGLKCAQWAAPLVRSRQRLLCAAENALSLQMGGAAGTLAELKGKGPQVIALMATELNLKAPPLAWHTQRDESIALACEFGLLIGSLGKIAKDMSLMSQFEVAELTDTEVVADQTLDHAAARMVVLVAAQRVPHRVASMLAGMPQELERGLGNWQAELAEWSTLLTSTQSATRTMVLLITGLQVNSLRMRSNLESQRAVLSNRQAAARYGSEQMEHAAELARTQLKILGAKHKPATGE